MSSEAQACSLCSSSICLKHRLLCGNVAYKDGKPLGGINCQCNDEVTCLKNQSWVRKTLGVPDPEANVAFIELKGKGGKSKVKGKGKDRAGKGQSKRGSSSSSSSAWRYR
jgi:hypothetical protein